MKWLLDWAKQLEFEEFEEKRALEEAKRTGHPVPFSLGRKEAHPDGSIKEVNDDFKRIDP